MSSSSSSSSYSFNSTWQNARMLTWIMEIRKLWKFKKKTCDRLDTVSWKMSMCELHDVYYRQMLIFLTAIIRPETFCEAKNAPNLLSTGSAQDLLGRPWHFSRPITEQGRWILSSKSHHTQRLRVVLFLAAPMPWRPLPHKSSHFCSYPFSRGWLLAAHVWLSFMTK